MILQKFVLPEEYNYANITSVSISGCVSANLHYSSLPEATHLQEMIVQNISGRLEFDVYISSKIMKLLKLSNIDRIPIIASHTFVSLMKIETIEIENVHIDVLEEDFSSLRVFEFILTNVTIERVNKLTMSEKGTSKILRILNTEFYNISTSINFAYFQKVEIVDSMFVLQKPGMLLIDSNNVIVERSVFTNLSMNVVASNFIKINGICADGKSALRLATYINSTSMIINSTNNRLPTEIAYPSHELAALNWRAQTGVFKQNNMVCKAGNCECPKGKGQGSQTCVSIPILGCLLIAPLLRNFF